MKKIIVLFANGTEELEALTPVDILRRTGAKCDIVSINGEFPVGSHNIIIKADKLIDSVDMNDYDAIVIPGGMPGATNIANNLHAIKIIKDAIKNQKLVASICASPAVVLAQNNLLSNKKATCYPAPNFIQLMGNNYVEKDLEISQNLITANGPKSAFKFALEIVKALGLNIEF